jgi:outer membrane protein OmpA-like peptidoglycan-associated protein
MKSARPVFVLAAVAVTTAAAACGKKHVTAPTKPGQALVVLLPDSDTGKTGRVIVRNMSGSADLSTERAATMVTPNHRPGPRGELTDADVNQLFSEALAALPTAPKRFTLYFEFESDTLTEESKALVPEVLAAIKERPVPDVVLVGHTDTMGTNEANFELGMKRATVVRDLLVQIGLDASAIDMTSHGEKDLLVKTPDETPEPRNRRVEIWVR